jgi:hypothetical protein
MKKRKPGYVAAFAVHITFGTSMHATYNFDRSAVSQRERLCSNFYANEHDIRR